MNPYYEEKGLTLYRGDNLEVLAEIGVTPEVVAVQGESRRAR